MAGKVLVPVQEHINRLIASRLQFDIMQTNTVLVSRTDAEAADMLTSNIDKRDHQFILGSTNPNQESLVDAMESAGSDLANVEEKWMKEAGLCLYSEAVSRELIKLGKANLVDSFVKDTLGKSLSFSKNLAKSHGVVVFWDWVYTK